MSSFQTIEHINSKILQKLSKLEQIETNLTNHKKNLSKKLLCYCQSNNHAEFVT